MNSIGRNGTEVKRNSGETFGMSQTTPGYLRLTIERTIRDDAHAVLASFLRKPATQANA